METNKLYNADCLEKMKDIPEESVDMICTDLPYGTTACQWDSIIPFEPLWEQYKRVIKNTGAIVLFSQQPFTSALIMSNIGMWKYNWVWQKDNGTNFLNSHHQPLKITEDICVFGYAATTENANGVYLTYNPQMRKGYTSYKCISGKQRKDTAMVRNDSGARNGGTMSESDGSRYPINLISFNRDKNERLHPTQKPVNLVRYLICTYTNEGETVLDSCCGSETTAIAAIREKRNWICIEKSEEYFNIAKKRIETELSQPNLF